MIVFLKLKKKNAPITSIGVNAPTETKSKDKHRALYCKYYRQRINIHLKKFVGRSLYIDIYPRLKITILYTKGYILVNKIKFR